MSSCLRSDDQSASLQRDLMVYDLLNVQERDHQRDTLKA